MDGRADRFTARMSRQFDSPQTESEPIPRGAAGPRSSPCDRLGHRSSVDRAAVGRDRRAALLCRGCGSG
jgi:hypothetical protein